MDQNLEDLPKNQLDFENICRTCLAEGEIRPIFKSNLEVMVPELLKKYTNIDVSETDEKPNKICDNCINELKRIHNFMILCIKTNEKLNNFLKYAKRIKNSEDLLKHDKIISDSENGEYVTEKTQCESENDDLNNEEVDVNVKIDDDDNLKIEDVKPINYKCNICDESFGNAILYKEHRKNFKHPRKKDHVCKVCSKTFTFSHLKIHMRCHTSEKPFSCQICGQNFSLNCNLQRHLLIHSGIRPHKCNICKKSFTQSTTLSQHLQTHNNKEKSYLCSYCGRDFSCMAGLKSHSKIHTGIRPYSCSVCNKSFTHISTMKSHVLIHTGQKPFSCTICSRSFTQRNHLRYHHRTHSGERPFSCNVCSKTFALKGNLTVHLRMHSGETPYVCSICEKGFYDSSSLKKHIKSHGEEINT